MPNEIKVSAAPTKLKVGDLVRWKATLPELGHDEAGAPTVVLPNEDCIALLPRFDREDMVEKQCLFAGQPERKVYFTMNRASSP